MIRVRIDTAAARRDFAALEHAIIKAGNEAIAQAVDAAAQHARATTLFRDQSGGTRHSVEGVAFAGSGHVSAGEAAVFLENGTMPHVIEAKNAQTLRFVVNGETVFRRSVQHPGTQPRPFMTDARNEGERVAEHDLEQKVTDAVRAH
jgi:hypothetical protein